MRTLILTIAACLVPETLRAQVPEIHGPFSGVVFDHASRSLRPLLGVPGAAYLAQPLLAAVDLASVAPNGTLALIIQENGVELVRNLDLTPQHIPLKDLAGLPDQALWAPDSSTVVVYSAAGQCLQRLRGLTEAPLAESPVDLSSIGGPVRLLAADRQARRILFSSDRAVYLVVETGPAALLAHIENPALAAFTSDGQDLYVAGASQWLEIRHRSGGDTVLPFTEDSLFRPAALALSEDDRLLYAAGRSPHLVRVYDRATRSLLTEIPLEQEPSALQRLPRPGLYHLGSRKPGEPLWLFQAGPQAAVYFVPVREEGK